MSNRVSETKITLNKEMEYPIKVPFQTNKYKSIRSPKLESKNIVAQELINDLILKMQESGGPSGESSPCTQNLVIQTRDHFLLPHIFSPKSNNAGWEGTGESYSKVIAADPPTDFDIGQIVNTPLNPSDKKKTWKIKPASLYTNEFL